MLEVRNLSTIGVDSDYMNAIVWVDVSSQSIRILMHLNKHKLILILFPVV